MQVLQGIKVDVTGTRGIRKTASLADDVVVLANPKGKSFTIAVRDRIWFSVADGDAPRYEMAGLTPAAQKEQKCGPVVVLFSMPEPMGFGAVRTYQGKRGADRAEAPYRSFRIPKDSEVAKYFPNWPQHGLKTATYEVTEIETSQGMRKALVLTGWAK